MRVILTTVGTSLMTNCRKAREMSHEQTPSVEELVQYLQDTSAEKASAETNSLWRLLQEGDTIVLLRSETPEGRDCTNALCQFYQRQGYRCTVEEVPDLRYDEQRFKVRGLRTLVSTMARIVRQHQREGHTVLINATGGFKAEIAYAVLIGQLFKVPVYYIHEAFRDIIELPPIPVQWDYSVLVNYEEFFEWLEQDLRTETEAHSRLQGLPDEVRMLLAEEEGYVMLSPAGEAFLEAYRYEREQPSQPVYWSRRARQYFESLSGDRQRTFERLVQRLARVNLRSNNIEPMRDSDCLVYPRGDRAERIVFYEHDGNLYICELARHGDQSYERLYERGVRRRDYTDFERWEL